MYDFKTAHCPFSVPLREINFTGGTLIKDAEHCCLRVLNVENMLVFVRQYNTSHMSLQMTRTMMNEISNLVALDHPNITRLYGIYETSFRINILFEFAACDLFSYSRSNCITEEYASRYIIGPLLSTITYFKAMNIVHKNIKPENMIRFGQNMWKLCSFANSINSQLEWPFNFSGTPDFMPPEVMCGIADESYRSAPEKIDIYAIGKLVFDILVLGVNGYKLSYECRNFIAVCTKQHFWERATCTVLLEHPWIVKYDDKQTAPTLRKSITLGEIELCKFGRTTANLFTPEMSSATLSPENEFCLQGKKKKRSFMSRLSYFSTKYLLYTDPYRRLKSEGLAQP